ncbi:thymidylate kinase [Cryptococcus wingfieldii CBS 7118]|uniref:Thymidylate kinase n=1 Tax=Cryptococcus wingfieldii CBS 7118 TaxID=1295528 RepID=A0A1E3K3B7_9TREE|nr:thymidylate kinase [Cryptococcus wingfieldii CBS 7118]ODO07545.1 thymidylate kinase [Cryptococcus wingfieldii CBS 7118]
MSTPTPRGAFIVFEGLDRCGKSTQVERLVGQLEKQGRKARLQKFPDRTTQIGKMIDAYLQSKAEMDDHAIHLLFSANRWECAEGIKRDLAAGITVIADRYAFSGIAFSAAKGLPFDFCLHPDTALPLPDLTLYLTLPPASAAQRSAFGTERYETVEIQQAVREQFKLVQEQVVQRHGEERWVEVNAEGTIEEVGEKIGVLVAGVAAGREGDVGQLWV